MNEISEVGAESRDKNIRIQIYFSILLRGLSVFLSFFVVRVTLDFLGKDLYAIWIILLSIISWLTLFDIGIGNGLRNKLSIALARGDDQMAKAYVSTAYLLIMAIGATIFALFIVFSFFIDWSSIFNSQLLSPKSYYSMMLIFFAGLIISFVLGLINPILNAFQKNSLTNVSVILTNSLFIISLLTFKNYFNGDIVKVVGSYSVSLTISNLLVTIFFFLKRKYLIPRYKYFSLNHGRDILTLGSEFFIIQIAVLLIFTVDNFIIIQLLGAQQVSIYNVAFKLFSIFTVGFGIIISPYWSAFTEAKEKLDITWMRSTLLKLNKLILLVLVGLVIFVVYYQEILNFWMPKKETIVPSFRLILSLGFFVLISVWNNIYSFFLNGIGFVKMQIRTSIIGALINVPLAILLVKILHFGLSGVVIAMCLSLSIFSVCGPLETYKFLKQNEYK